MLRKKNKSLTDVEISIIKRLHSDGKNNQEILGIINSKKDTPSLHINPGRISEVIKDKRGANVTAADDDTLKSFLEETDKKVEESPVSNITLSKLLKLKAGCNNVLDIDETTIFECKETFNTDVKSLIKPLISFANNKGGYILYGVKDSVWEVVGLSAIKLEAFNAWDMEKLSRCVFDYAGCGLDIRRCIYTINNKAIGIIYVFQATKRPVIMTKQDGDIAIGQIYYRYPSSSMLIGSAELNNIIEERVNSMISTTLARHIENIIKNGIENTAILNLKTGEVEGKSGNFVIDENLVSKIQFIKEGEFVEKKGAPALKLIGEIQPVSAIAEIEKEVEKSITIKMVIDAFVKQTIVSMPLEYIKAIALDTGKWIPIYYFIKKSQKSIEDIKKFLQDLIKTEGKNYPKNTIEMLNGGEIPSFGRKNEKTEMDRIKNKEIKVIDTKSEALAIIASIAEIQKDELDLKYCLKLLRNIISQFWNDKEIQTKVKYCCSYLDRMYYSSKIPQN